MVDSCIIINHQLHNSYTWKRVCITYIAHYKRTKLETLSCTFNIWYLALEQFLRSQSTLYLKAKLIFALYDKTKNNLTNTFERLKSLTLLQNIPYVLVKKLIRLKS